MEQQEFRVDSPTAMQTSRRILLSLATSKKWKVKSLDFVGAFLQGTQIDREVIVIPPKDSIKTKDGTKIYWKLLKPLYGLSDASRRWYKRLEEKLIELGCKKTTLDRAFFTYYDKNGDLGGVIAVHVDDCLYSGSREFQELVITPILESFNIGRIEEDLFVYTGWDIAQSSDEITIAQNSYIDKLDLEDLEKITETASNNSEVMSNNGQTLFRRIVGMISWIAQISKPELSFK